MLNVISNPVRKKVLSLLKINAEIKIAYDNHMYCKQHINLINYSNSIL
jgi:hypothetical protein